MSEEELLSKAISLGWFCRGMHQLTRDGYTFYYPTRDQMDSDGLFGVCSKKMQQLCLLHCALD